MSRKVTIEIPEDTELTDEELRRIAPRIGTVVVERLRRPQQTGSPGSVQRPVVVSQEQVVDIQ